MFTKMCMELSPMSAFAHKRNTHRGAFNCTNMIMEKYTQNLAVKRGERDQIKPRIKEMIREEEVSN